MRDFNNRGRSSGPRRDFSDRGSFGGDRQTFKAVCADCGRDCDLPFEPRGNRPVYCRDCFKNHPQEDRPARFDSRDSRGGDRGGFRRDDRGSDRQMFSAVCDNCGKTCNLPFRPTAGKPVYCSDCFEQKEKGAPMPRRGERHDAPRSNPSMDEINIKLDKILNLLSNTKALSKDKKVVDPEQDRRTSEAVEKEVAQLVKTVKAEKSIKPKKAAKKEDVRIVEPVLDTEQSRSVETPVEIPTETPELTN